MISPVGNSYGCSAGHTFDVLKGWAKREHSTNSPENLRRWQMILRNGHNRSLRERNRMVCPPAPP